MLVLSYTCPKRKCRHAWHDRANVVANADCPQCGAKDLNPVDVERIE